MDLYYKQRIDENMKYNFLDLKLPVGENKIPECQMWLDAGRPAVIGRLF